MRIRLIISLAVQMISVTSFGQLFEGEIVYANTYKSNIPSLSDRQLAAFLGSEQHYFIKGTHYKSIANGSAISMQLYDPGKNRIYNSTPKSDTLYWLDASVYADSVESYEIKSNAAMVLGYDCDAIVLKSKTTIITMFYSSKIKLDSSGFKTHRYGNWSFYAGKIGALPLKIIMENRQFKMESVATEIKPKNLDPTDFEIDKRTPVKKS